MMDFNTARQITDKYKLSDFSDAAKVESYITEFALRDLLIGLEEDAAEASESDLSRTVDPGESTPFAPEFDDLCRLHFLVISRKVLNVLEFGSGFSTAVMASAMAMLRAEFGQWAADNLRVAEPFKVYAVEEDARYTEITRKRLGEKFNDYGDISHSTVTLTEHDFRYVTLYDDLPNISPDLIYLDGPSQFAAKETINGFSQAASCRMPMAADILRVEFYLEPGTLILVDGRTANARFLKSYLRRNWTYEHDAEADIHLFELDETPLGKFNARKLEFCLG